MAKHIVVCSTSFADYDRRMQRIIKVLVESDYQVTWLSRGHCHLASVKHIKIKPFFSAGILFYLGFNLRMYISLIRLKKDIIYAVDLDTILAAYIAKNEAKLVFDSHEYYTEVPELLHKPIKKKIWATIANKLIPKTHLAITVNESLAKIFKEKYKQAFHVIRNVPHKQLTQSSTTENHKVLIYQGALNQGRGIELAIDAMEHLPEYQLIIVGEGDLSDQLRAQVSEKQLDQQVIFKGWVKPDDLHKLSTSASIGLNMLEPLSLNYTYSLANKFFDYMHAGIPSINMQFPEYQEICNQFDVAVLVQEYNTEALIKSIRILEDPAIYQSKKQASSQAAQHFHWEQESEKLISLFESV